jgi:hypothetical protein
MKKLSIFLVLALLLVLFSSIVMAQSQKALDNRTVVIPGTWPGYWQPIYCNGEMVDYLYGEVSNHMIMHFKNGENIRNNIHVFGQVTSGATSEVFTVHENDKVDNLTGIATWHFNLVGNEGTHYIGAMTWDMINDPFFEDIVVNKAVCPGN